MTMTRRAEGSVLLIVVSFLLMAIANLQIQNGYTDISARAHKLKTTSAAIPDIPTFPNEFELRPVVDIPLPKGAVFLSCVRIIPKSTTLTCHFRQNWNAQGLGKVILDQNFHTISPVTRNALPGEDPRSFVVNGTLYVIDNYLGKMELHRVGTTVSSWRLPAVLGTKNISPVLTNLHVLLFVDFQQERIHRCIHVEKYQNNTDFQCKPLTVPIQWNYKGGKSEEFYHRGGTPGIQIFTHDRVYAGFGHLTQKTRGSHHDIFFWKLNMSSSEEFMMDIKYLSIPHDSDNSITDPSSLVSVGDDWYLFTAESEGVWTSQQIYVQRVYRIQETSVPHKNISQDTVVAKEVTLNPTPPMMSCQEKTLNNIPALKAYLASLDVWIVSHGGVGSNALVDYMKEHSYKVKPNIHDYQVTCHVGSPEMVTLLRDSNKVPTLVIVGDIWNSMVSQHKRKWLAMNIAKNIYGTEDCKKNFSHYLTTRPTDPVGIKSLILTHSKQENVVFLQAPYTKESVMEALKRVGLPGVEEKMSGFQVRPRTSKNAVGSISELEALYEPYKEMQSVLNHHVPLVWDSENNSARLMELLSH